MGMDELICTADKISTMIAAPEVIAKIVDKLGDANWAVRLAVITTLVELFKHGKNGHLV